MPDDVKAPVPPAAAAAVVAPPPAAVAAPPPSDSLKELKAKLQKNQDDSANLATEGATLKQQVADLQKLVDQNTSAGKTYASAAKALIQQQADLQTYFNTKKTMLEATLKDKKDVVVKAKQAGDQEVADLQKKVDDLKKKVVDETKAYSAAQADTATQQAAYDNVASNLSRAGFWINDSTALRTGAEGQKSQSRAYFHLLEMDDSLKKTALPTADDFAKQLDDATSKLTAAKNAERDQKQALDQDTASLQQAQKALDDASTKRRDKILNSIPAEDAAAAG